ncbi:MAG: hypothetical protein E7310_00705 [Clostridiales bacterium]|nr:hypothetical protein [Clostridiales bacterium]
MININEILDIAIEKDASDIHLISGIAPTLRIARDLISIGDEELTESDMYEIYDFFVRGNINKDEMYRETKKIDTSFEYKELRLRVNISSTDGIPVFTLRIIKNNLPTFEELGVPDIVRRMTRQPQGLILVTGKTNSRKNYNTKCINK